MDQPSHSKNLDTINEPRRKKTRMRDSDQVRPKPACAATEHYENMSTQHAAIFHGFKNDNFQLNIVLLFSYICSKRRLWVHVRTASVIYV